MRFAFLALESLRTGQVRDLTVRDARRGGHPVTISLGNPLGKKVPVGSPRCVTVRTSVLRSLPGAASRIMAHEF